MNLFLAQANVSDTVNETGGAVSVAIDFLKTHGPEYIFQILMAIVILIVGRIVANVVRNAVTKAMRSRNVDASLVGFCGSLIFFIIMAFTIIAVIGRFGVKTTSFVAILGAGAFAVGMALQGTLANFASGVMILLFRPFKVGDFIEAAGVAGVVKEISIFSTIVGTGDNKKVIVPNGQAYGGVITNYNGYATRRIDMVMGIGYESDMNKAMDIMNRILEGDARVLKDPSPTVAVSELADSSVNFVVRPWVKAGDYWAVKFDFLKKCKEEFDAAGIEIPFPQTVVHMSKLEN
ncbi:mechanosensitive ion channel protein [bacterium DOLJORAL78_65_58]|nr:MAG: mechanosensitive ion channel protein [bacterium DOLZORAL124_64_63]PIE76099.1 MAG: mechanosensitive ion channel protein [bacterium DOLJORAL78_65_58]